MLESPRNKMLPRKFISVKEYADSRGITKQAVYDAIRNGWKMPGIVEVHKVGKNGFVLVPNQNNGLENY